jgi:single-strand DNA-binding protein
MNKAILMGNIANDIELRQTQNGTMTARFRVACRRSRDETDFITCTAFGKTAELISKHFAKGSRILVEGNIKTGSYDDTAGKKVYTTEIWVSSIDFPEKAQTASPNPTAPQGQPAPNAQRPPAQPAYNQQGYQQQPSYQNFPQDYDYGDLPY